jgi:hypothetical protein
MNKAEETDSVISDMESMEQETRAVALEGHQRVFSAILVYGLSTALLGSRNSITCYVSGHLHQYYAGN